MTDDEVKKRIDGFVNDINHREITLHTAIFAQYLSNPDNIQKFSEDSCLYAVFESYCDFIVSESNSDKKDLASLSLLSKFCSDFLSYFVTRNVAKAYSNHNEADQEKKEEIRRELDASTYKIYDKLVSSLIMIVEKTTEFVASSNQG